MNLSIKLSSLLMVASMMLVSSVEGHEKVKYVQGGSCEGGNGSKKHPFNNLNDAEAAEWDVLIVLSSTTALDGGITLKNGQKLVGEENPTDIALSPTQPTITNTDSNNHGGNAVIVTGDATIENIYFKDTQASAIQYNDAKDLTVRNVLISGYGKGVDDAAGISGTCPNSGETRITHVIIRDNANTGGAGIHDEPVMGAHRELVVCTSEFSGLNWDGIESYPDGADTTSSVRIKNTYMHDTPSGITDYYGMDCASYNGANQTVLVKDSRFTNLGAESLHIYVFAEDNGCLTLNVDTCSFEDHIGNDEIYALYIENNPNQSSIEACVENCTIHLAGSKCYAFQSDLDSGTQNCRFVDNKVTVGDQGRFYGALNNFTSGKINTVIKDNFFTGSTAIEILSLSPWESLTIEAIHNCFQGDGTAAAFVANGPASTSATLRAHKNSISGFNPDIKETDNAGVFYDVTKNWWGHATNVPCTPGPCPQFQTCVGVTCKGPVVEGTTNVDARDPLIASIKCPHNCCQPLPTPPAPQP